MKRYLLLPCIFLFCGVAYAEDDDSDPKLSEAQVEEKTVELLRTAKDFAAQELLDKYAYTYNHNQHIVFLQAACRRTRFYLWDPTSVRQADQLFRQVVDLDKDSDWAKCASYMLALDVHRDVDTNMQALRDLVEAHPDDMVLRWMIAVECRWQQNAADSAKNRKLAEEGAKHDRKILAKWKPGPLLVHQTYANFLLDLGKREEAIAEYRTVIKLQPQAAWAYDSMAVTLGQLKRWAEAEDASRKATEINSEKTTYWSNWAWLLASQNKSSEAIEKCQKAVEVDPRNANAWTIWGNCLEADGDAAGALEKYQRAMEHQPSDELSKRIEALKKKQGQ